MNLAAFQQRHLVNAKRFGQLPAHVGEAFGISRQKSRQDAFDRLRRCSQLEHAVGRRGPSEYPVDDVCGAFRDLGRAFVTIWCGFKGWTKERQRGIYQPFILIVQLVAIATGGRQRTLNDAPDPFRTPPISLSSYFQTTRLTRYDAAFRLMATAAEGRRPCLTIRKK